MWKTVHKRVTNRLISLNAQTWWGVIKRIMKDSTQYCNKMQKNVVWKHLQAYVEISIWLPDELKTIPFRF